jgi:trimeric autotransporter adhesin
MKARLLLPMALLVTMLVCLPENALPSQPSFTVSDVCSHNCDTSEPVFQVDNDGGFVAYGQLGIGTIPASGDSLRTMWYPFKGAFRTGSPGTTGNLQWEDADIGFYSFAGGNASRASAYGTFSFGDNVYVTGVSSTGFGSSVTVSGTAGFSAGANNFCTGFGCTAIGFGNGARGQGAVALGYRAIAGGDYGVAIGARATTCDGTSFSSISGATCPGSVRVGAMVFADASTNNFVGATENNQFVVRAAGGYRLYTNPSVSSGVTINAGGGSWNTLSDRNLKRDFEPVDSEQLLDRLGALQVTTWRYLDEQDQAVRHIGPTAQDWQRVVAGPLGLNDDENHINQGDFDGVNLLAVIALEARTRRLAEENETLRAELRALHAASAAEAERRQADLARLEQLTIHLEMLTGRLLAERNGTMAPTTTDSM